MDLDPEKVLFKKKIVNQQKVCYHKGTSTTEDIINSQKSWDYLQKQHELKNAIGESELSIKIIEN